MTGKSPQEQPPRFIVSVIGDAGGSASAANCKKARELGRLLVDANYRVCSGGLGGVMEAAFQGARDSAAHREGDTIAILPALDHRAANPYADIVIPTGLGHLRNGIVAAAHAVVAIGGQVGTLSEMAFAWRYCRLIVALSTSGGVAAQYAGKALDNRKDRHPALAKIAPAETPAEAVEILNQNLPACYVKPQGF